ncbi:hypothetical protein [Rathayibacter sp. AY1E4]|uniref:hypothetical protein n=2 Tax=unclassified Rathayibacter TaxID=2609250 RepID=UPI0011B07809|nr:hypothetical protein [Rathayibacter sp. AY1E4]
MCAALAAIGALVVGLGAARMEPGGSAFQNEVDLRDGLAAVAALFAGYATFAAAKGRSWKAFWFEAAGLALGVVAIWAAFGDWSSTILGTGVVLAALVYAAVVTGFSLRGSYWPRGH